MKLDLDNPILCILRRVNDSYRLTLFEQVSLTPLMHIDVPTYEPDSDGIERKTGFADVMESAAAHVEKVTASGANAKVSMAENTVVKLN